MHTLYTNHTICTHTYTHHTQHTHTHTYIHTYTHMHTNTHKHTHIPIHTYTHMHPYTHIDTHTCTYTLTCTHRGNSSRSLGVATVEKLAELIAVWSRAEVTQLGPWAYSSVHWDLKISCHMSLSQAPSAHSLFLAFLPQISLGDSHRWHHLFLSGTWGSLPPDTGSSSSSKDWDK